MEFILVAEFIQDTCRQTDMRERLKSYVLLRKEERRRSGRWMIAKGEIPWMHPCTSFVPTTGSAGATTEKAARGVERDE